MKTFFTADTHFGHRNIIKFSNRPWDNVDKMNEDMITTWNKQVAPEDTVFHLGDFSMGGEKPLKILKRLNGHKHLIIGNHDKKIINDDEWITVSHYKEITVNKQRIVLSHYAMRVWNGSHKGTWMLYGHSHGSLSNDLSVKSFDVGVDCHNYRLLEFASVERIMKKHGQESVDHHGKSLN